MNLFLRHRTFCVKTHDNWDKMYKKCMQPFLEDNPIPEMPTMEPNQPS